MGRLAIPSARREDQIFKALASPEIRLLLELINAGDRTVEDIAHEVMPNGDPSTLLQNLVILGLVSRVKLPKGSFYRLDPTGIDVVREWVMRFPSGTADNRT